ncbi:MAG: T9SS type A sorting domain-containing protein [Saprospiraceae bacterium]|nr:T9SS type A sorting domain-containing protein [Saprospiraceae bacterium]
MGLLFRFFAYLVSKISFHEKTLLLTCFLLSSIISMAQAVLFPTPGMVFGDIFYCNVFDCPNGEYSNWSFFYEGDTTICGKTFHRMTHVHLPGYSFYIRVESGKYLQADYSDPCLPEKVIYDFNLQVGDTFVPAEPDGGTGEFDTLIVEEIGNFTLANGETRKRILLQSLMYWWKEFEWIEGIGDIQNGFLMAYDFEGGHEEIICVKDSSGLLFQNTAPLLDCDSLLCRAPQSWFNFTCESQTIYFENLSTFSDTYLWDYGDGSTSTEAFPSHTYAVPGCYRVELSAYSNCFSQPFKSSRQVNVALGNYWQPVFTPDFSFKSSFFLDGQHGWLVWNDSIHRTTDGGANWQHIALPPPANPDYQSTTAVHFFDELHGILTGYDWYPSNDSTISNSLWTTDGGITWQYSTPPQRQDFWTVAMSSPTTGYAAGQYSIWIHKTTDGGNTWHPLDNQLFYQVQNIQHIAGDTIYFIGNKWPGPYYSPFIFGKSTDGTNFSLTEITSVNFPEISVYDRPTDFHFLDASNGWFVTAGGLIFHTNDGGAQWELQMDADVYLTGIRFINAQHGLAIGSYKSIFETWDGGENWEYTYCSPTSLYGYGNLNWPVESFPTIIGDFTLLTLSDTPVYDDCSPLDATEVQAKNIFVTVQPNPANDEVVVNFTLPAPTKIEVGVYDLLGRKLRTILPFQELPNGEFSENLSVRSLPNGMYLIHFQSDSGVNSIKFIKQ